MVFLAHNWRKSWSRSQCLVWHGVQPYENQHAEIFTTESSGRAFEEEVMLSGLAYSD